MDMNNVDTFDITIQPNFNTGLVDISLSNNYYLRFTNSTFHNILGFNSVILTSSSSSTKNTDVTNSITSINVRANIATGSFRSDGNSSDIIYSFTPTVSPYSYISQQPTNPVYVPITTHNAISNITMRITDNLNSDLDLRNEPVNFLLHLRVAKN